MDRDDKILTYLQDRMGPDDRVAFEGEMAADAGLTAEVSALRAARAAMEPDGVPDGSAGWDRLSAAIDRERQENPPAPANDNRPIRLSLLQAAGVALAAVVLWQLLAAPFATDRGVSFIPASDPVGAPSLQVVFAETAPMGDISALLGRLDGTIVSGPGALGLYHIRFEDEAARAAAQAALEAAANLVADVMVE